MNDYLTQSDEVLQNKLGISDPIKLKKVEGEVGFARQMQLESEPLPLHYDFDLLKRIHFVLFSDIYDFAGKVRCVDITKGPVPFCYVQNIDTEQKRIFCNLKIENYLKGLHRESFVERLVYYAAELNALHPFREGNGRTIRVFLGLLAQNAGLFIRYHMCTKEDLLYADIQAFSGDLYPLTELYYRIIQSSTATIQ